MIQDSNHPGHRPAPTCAAGEAPHDRAGAEDGAHAGQRYDEGGYIRERDHEDEVDRYRDMHRRDRERAEERRRERRDRSRDEHLSPEELQAEIARTRAEISETVDALQEKASPGYILHRIADRATSETGDTLREAAVAIRRHPMPTILVGTGLAWLLLEHHRPRTAARPEAPGLWDESCDEFGSMHSREHRSGLHIGERLHRAGEAVGHALGSVRRAASGVGSRVSGAADDLTHRARQAKRTVKERAGEATDAMHDARGRVHNAAIRAREGAEEVYEHNPLAIGAAALATGLLAGLIIPATRREDRLMGETRDELLREAKDKTRAAVRAGVDAAEREADRHDMTHGRIAEGARDVAGAAVSAATQAADDHTRGYSATSPGEPGHRSRSRQQATSRPTGGAGPGSAP